MKRTHHCNELREEHVGQIVTLNGWVHSNRDLGGVVFIDVRDREGRTQAVFDPSDSRPICSRLPPGSTARASSASPAWCVRPDGTKNEKIDTGLVEVLADKLEVLNHADVLPFTIDDPEVAPGERGVAPQASLPRSASTGDDPQHASAQRSPPPRGCSWRNRASSKSRRRPCSRARRRARGNSSSPAESTPASFTPCPSRRNSTSRSSCAPGWTNTSARPLLSRRGFAGRSPA